MAKDILFGAVASTDAYGKFALILEGLEGYARGNCGKLVTADSAIGILGGGLSMPLEEENFHFLAIGRLDYRDDLCAKLQVTRELSDEKLIQIAYLKWGESVVHHLEGDWILVAYHHDSGKFFMARDKTGYTSMFYWQHKGSLLFSSHPIGLYTLSEFRRKINGPSLVSKLLLLRNGLEHDNIYEEVQMLPPAHSLTLQNGQSQLRRYWFPENIDEYEVRPYYKEELVHLLGEAVRQKLKNVKKTALLLSGGIDSGTVAVLGGKSAGVKLDAFSHVPLFDSGDKFTNFLHDEAPQIHATAKVAGIRNIHWVRSPNFTPVQGLFAFCAAFQTVTHAVGNYFWTVDLFSQAQALGYTHLLTGELGNGTISYSGVANLPPYGKNRVKQWTKNQLLKFCPSLLFTKKKGFQDYISNQYLHPEVLNAYKDLIEESQQLSRAYYPNALAAKISLLSPGKNNRSTLGGLRKIIYGMELLDPTADVRVLEYCLKLPNHLYFSEKGEKRQVIKSSMKGILPDEVLFAKRKGRQSSDLYFRLLHSAQEVEALLYELQQNVESRTWMNIPKLQKDWQVIKEGKRTDYLFAINFFKGMGFAYFVGLR